MILECQNRTISRGPHSIFARLRKEGIDVRNLVCHTARHPKALNQPNDYIAFFSLRTWGKMRGDVLTTEQVMKLEPDSNAPVLMIALAIHSC